MRWYSAGPGVYQLRGHGRLLGEAATDGVWLVFGQVGAAGCNGRSETLDGAKACVEANVWAQLAGRLVQP